MASTSGVHLSAKTDAPSTGAEGSGLGAGVPSLRRLCMQLIGDARVDVDNVLAALELGTAHGIPALRNRAERFVRSTWKGVRAQHSEEALQEALGRDVFAAFEREQADLDAAVRKLKPNVSGEDVVLKIIRKLLSKHCKRESVTFAFSL